MCTLLHIQQLINELFIFKFSETKQRPHLLLFVPNPTWVEIHPFGQRVTSGPEAEQLVIKHDM